MDLRVHEDSGFFKGNSTRISILSRLPFMRPSATTAKAQTQIGGPENVHLNAPSGGARSHQTDLKRRKASLRKAVLGREAAVRDNREPREYLASNEHNAPTNDRDDPESAPPIASDSDCRSETSDVTPWPAFDDPNDGSNEEESAALGSVGTTADAPQRIQPTSINSSALSYKSTSTTDDDEGLHMPQPTTSGFRANLSFSSGLDSFFNNRKTASARRPSQIARAPLSYTAVGLSTTSFPSTEADWDYGETETWGWIILIVTWFVFVTGMGSCFGVWSWAWDVGTTPYAPPELEDDPTLPIVGYYPALLILTCVMAWIWVMVAWVGMKYFRHAKITGD